jgi:hypothetical protein
MLDRRVMRLAGIAAMVGAVIAVVFNVLHPRPDDVETVRGAVESAKDEGIWLIDHYLLAWTVGLALFAFVAISRTFVREPSASWGRVALVFGISGASVAFATIVMDGWAVKEAVDVEGEQVAFAVAYVAEGMFIATIGAFFGLTPVLFGVAVLSSDEYPVWLGWVAVVAGLLGILTGSIIFFSGFSDFIFNVLFPTASLLFTVWIGLMGYQMYQRASEPASAVAAMPTAP